MTTRSECYSKTSIIQRFKQRRQQPSVGIEIEYVNPELRNSMPVNAGSDELSSQASIGIKPEPDTKLIRGVPKFLLEANASSVVGTIQRP